MRALKHPTSGAQHVAVRLDAETIARVEALGPALSTPWRKAKRSDLLRAAIHEGLLVLEARQAPAKKGGRK